MEVLLIVVLSLFVLMTVVPLVGILWLEKKIVDVQWERIQKRIQGYLLE